MTIEELMKRHEFLCELRDVGLISADVKRKMTTALLAECLGAAT